MSPNTRAVATALSLLPLAGCCSMAQGLSALFCGPRPALPRRSYLTPDLALGTLLGAIASDDARTIWESVGPDLKQAMDIDQLGWEIAWRRLKEENPGIHIADQATRNPAIEMPPTRERPYRLVAYTLALPGTRIEVTFRRHAFYKTMLLLPGENKPTEQSGYVERFEDLLELRQQGESFPIEIRSPGLEFAADKSEIVSAGVGVEWLVHSFRINPPQQRP